MSVNLVFGLPGSGKTTLLTYLALRGCKSRRYQTVYTNVDLALPYPYCRIQNSDVGTYDIHDGLVLIDEAIVFADNRNYKNFVGNIVTWFVEHRHDRVDIWFFSQSWDALDKRIRQITDRAYYIYKGFWTGWYRSKYYRIPYGIIIPDPKKNGSDKLGEIVQGYCKPNLLVRMFCKKLKRRKYYKYFDSWERRDRPPLPLDRYIQPECNKASVKLEASACPASGSKSRKRKSLKLTRHGVVETSKL